MRFVLSFHINLIIYVIALGSLALQASCSHAKSVNGYVWQSKNIVLFRNRISGVIGRNWIHLDNWKNAIKKYEGERS